MKDRSAGEAVLGQVVSQSQLILHVAAGKRNGSRIVLTYGRFDLLHPGHIRCLEQARACGDLLVVAIDGDANVRGNKGPSRPLVAETERAEILAALAAVNYVTVFNEPTPHNLIARLLPDVLVKCGDCPGEIVGREEVEAAGGRVASIQPLQGYSTTSILERVRSAESKPQRSSSPGGLQE